MKGAGEPHVFQDAGLLLGARTWTSEFPTILPERGTNEIPSMSVKLRFVRIGKKNRPAYRLCAIESRRARDGQYLENLGFYDPYIEDDKKKIRIEKARAEYWLSVGAEPSQTVLDFFRREKISGLIRQRPKRKRRKKSVAKAAPGTAGGVAKGATASAKPPRKQKPPKKPKAPKAEAQQHAPASPPGGSE